MGIIVRQSLKAGFGFYLGALIGIINQMFVSTHFLSVEQLAVSRLLIENALLFATFSHIGAPLIADKFFGYFRNDEQQHQGLFLFLLSLPLLGGTVFTILYFVFTPEIESYFVRRSPLLVDYHKLVVPFTFLWVYLMVLESYCRNHARIAIPSFIREVYLRSMNVLLILMFGMGWYSFDTLLYLTLAAYGLAVAFLLYYVAHLGKLYLRWPSRGYFTKAQVRKMLGYGSFSLLSGLGVSLLLTIDRSMLAGEKGLISTGIFIIAAYIAGIIEIPKKAISQISIPYISDALRLGKIEEVRTLTQKSALHQLLVGGIFFLILWVNIDDLFRFLPKGEIYMEGKFVVLLIGLIKVFDIGTGLNTEIILYSKYYRWATIMIVAAAFISFVLNLWLIPIYGFNGAAAATVLTTLGLSIAKLLFVQRKFKIHPFTLNTLKLLLMFSGLFILISFYPSRPHTLWQSFFTMAIKSGILLLGFGFMVYKFQISPEVNKVMDTVLNRLRKQG